MSKSDRILDAIEALCRYCPACAKELVEKQATATIFGKTLKTIMVKVCPNEHVELSSGIQAYSGPYAAFELHKELYADVE